MVSSNPEMAAREAWGELSTVEKELLLGAMVLELQRLMDSVESWLPAMTRSGDNTVVVPITLRKQVVDGNAKFAYSKWASGTVSKKDDSISKLIEMAGDS